MTTATPMSYGVPYLIKVGSLSLSYDDPRKWAYLYSSGIAVTFAPYYSTSTQILDGDVVRISGDIHATNYLTLPADGSDYLRWSLIFSDTFTIVSPAASAPPAPGDAVPIDLGATFSLIASNGDGQVCLDATGVYFVLADSSAPAAFVASA